MKFLIHDFVSDKGVNEFNQWAMALEKVQRAKLREKIDKLMMHGDSLHPEMLSDTTVPGIQKLRIRGPVQLRPLLCKGPIDINQEYTMLMGAKEIGDKWSPKNAPTTAKTKKDKVILDPVNRRKKHARIA
jgi:hypothetical protein